MYGSGWPLAARSLARAVGAAAVMYSSHSAASSGVPEPMLMETYGVLPICWMKSMNSSVPKAFVSITSPHAEFTVAGRFSRGPIPLRQ